MDCAATKMLLLGACLLLILEEPPYISIEGSILGMYECFCGNSG